MQGLLILAALIGGWWLMARWGKKYGWGNAKRHLLGGVFGACAAVIVGIFVLVSAISKVPATPGVAASPTTGPEESEVKADRAKREEPSLGITLDEFVSNFNNLTEEMKSPTAAPVPEIDDGSVRDTANIDISNDWKVIVTLNKGTRDVRGVSFLGAGDGTNSSVVAIMAASTAAALAVFEKKDRERAGKAFGELMGEAKADADSISRVVEGKRMWMSLSTLTGYMVGVEPEEDEST